MGSSERFGEGFGGMGDRLRARMDAWKEKLEGRKKKKTELSTVAPAAELGQPAIKKTRTLFGGLLSEKAEVARKTLLGH